MTTIVLKGGGPPLRIDLTPLSSRDVEDKNAFDQRTEHEFDNIHGDCHCASVRKPVIWHLYEILFTYTGLNCTNCVGCLSVFALIPKDTTICVYITLLPIHFVKVPHQLTWRSDVSPNLATLAFQVRDSPRNDLMRHILYFYWIDVRETEHSSPSRPV